VAIGQVQGCTVQLKLTLPGLDLNNWTANSGFQLEIRQQLASVLGAAVDDVTISLVYNTTQPAAIASNRRLLATGIELQATATLSTSAQAADAVTHAPDIQSLTVGGIVYSTTVAPQYTAVFSYDPPNVTALLPSSHPNQVSGDDMS